jgi:hypothetical protein
VRRSLVHGATPLDVARVGSACPNCGPDRPRRGLHDAGWQATNLRTALDDQERSDTPQQRQLLSRTFYVHQNLVVAMTSWESSTARKSMVRLLATTTEVTREYGHAAGAAERPILGRAWRHEP